MRDAYGGVSGVDALPAGPGRPENINAQIRLGYIDVISCFGDREHFYACKRGLSAALVVERRDANKPMCALLNRKRPVREGCLDLECCGLDTRLFGVGRVVDLSRVTM